MSAVFLETQSQSVSQLDYQLSRDPAFKLSDAERHVFLSGFYSNGLPYHFVQLIPGDEYPVQAVCEDVLSRHPLSLRRRTADEHRRLIGNNRFNGSGALMIGLVDHENYLQGIAAVEAMDDESDHGSGPVVLHNGVKDNYEQFHFKSLALLKEAEGKGHRKTAYAIRMGLFLLTGREFAVTKINPENETLIDDYTSEEKGWDNLSRKDLPGWELVYESEAAKNDKIVDVLVISRNKAAEWYEKNKAGLAMPNLTIIPHAPAPYSLQ